MKKNIILSAALMFFGLTAQAQTQISFENEDYKAISVYDSWAESPFRAATPVIAFDAAVAENPDTEVDAVMGVAPNGSEKVVKLRRSRRVPDLMRERLFYQPVKVEFLEGSDENFFETLKSDLLGKVHLGDLTIGGNKEN